MPGEEMIRWSQPPREVALTKDEIDLVKAIQDYLDEAYELFFADTRPSIGTSPIDVFRLQREQPRGIPRQEPKLGALPIITSDETEGHYGTSGDLEPRGYWMPIDGEASR